MRLALCVPVFLQGNFFDMRYIYILSALCLLVIASCTGSNTNNTAESKPALPPQSKLDDSGTHLLLKVVDDYYSLKDALVATKAEKAEAATAPLVTSASDMQAYLLKDSANAPLAAYFDTIKAATESIAAIKDPTCEQQRVPFSQVSNTLYTVLKQTGMKNSGVYQQFCPMAFNDQGAYWLSNEAEIRNPYFGKKMLECGDVTDSL